MGDTVEIRRKDALKVAERINAHVVIYGNIDSQGNFIPEFYVKPQLEHDVDAITGGYQLGDTPIQLDPSNATATADKLATRANALFWLVVGVDYIVRGDTTKAFGALDLAQKEFVQMGSHEGEELLYFFRGQAQLFQARDAIGNRCTLDKVKPYLDEAENNLRQALTLDPRFLRAQVALSGVYQLRALCVPSATRLTSKEMAQAIAEAQRSLELAPQSEDHVTAEGRAVYQMGVVYNLLGSTYLELGRAALKEGKVDLAKQQFAEADRNFDAGIAQVQQSREAMSQADNPQRAQAQVYRALGNATAQKAILRQEQHQTNDLATLYTTANQYYQQCIDQGKANQHDKVLGRIIGEATVGCAPRATFVQNALTQLK
jgi:tetratricopeptide (TPR) repeat protein